MNFDLIKKLIKLANNNPNDNEANLAARKVCKLLADYAFGAATEAPRNRPTPPNAGPTRSNPFTGNPFSADFIEEMLRQNREAAARERARDARRQEYDAETYQRREYERARRYQSSVWDIPYTAANPPPRQEPRPDKRSLACTKCGKVKLTAYVGNLYVCNECQWTDYQQQREPSW